MNFSKIALVFVCLVLIGSSRTTGASQATFSSTTTAVQQAFVSVQDAGKVGGNVTSLVAQLNGALALIGQASSENMSNPDKASRDLNSALAISHEVQASAGTVAQQGLAARQFQLEVSIGSAVGIVAIAIALYVYGDRIYHRLWLRTYRKYVVREVG